jgi:H+/gluconate symporter-like permease
MEEMIDIWQQAKTAGNITDQGYQADELIPMIARLEKKQQKLVTFKTVSVICLLLAILILLINRMDPGLFTLLGMGVFLLSTLAILVVLNHLRFRINEGERSLSTLKLAEITEQKINAERKIFTRYIPIFLLLALTGINLLYVDLIGDLEAHIRILAHLLLSGTMLAAAVLGLFIRIKRFRKQFLPLLDRIQEFKNEAA